MKVITPVLPGFVSDEFTLGQQLWDVPHGLGAVPSLVRAVLVCVTADANTGYSPGDEIDALTLFDPSNVFPLFAFGANATEVFVVAEQVPTTSPAVFQFRGGNTGPGQPSSWNNFRLKVYAKL